MNLDEDVIRGVFELEKTAVNQTDLVSRIHHNLKSHDLKGPQQWPKFALATDSINAAFASDSGLHNALSNALKEYDKIGLELSIPASDKSFITRLKRPFHQLVLFYVNKIGQRQIMVNDRLLRIINHLVISEEKKDKTIKELRAQLADLQKRVEELEHNQP